jgi:hypothetical protein
MGAFFVQENKNFLVAYFFTKFPLHQTGQTVKRLVHTHTAGIQIVLMLIGKQYDLAHDARALR